MTSVIVALVIDKDYEVTYGDPANPKKVKGKLKDLDVDGFVVLEDSEGRTMLIPKDGVIIFVEDK
jgi:hypothetical protein